MALNENEKTALAVTVAARIAGSVLGREASGGVVEQTIAESAVQYLTDIAPEAPLSILREASIRMAGWLYGARPHASMESHADPTGTQYSGTFTNTAATASAYRASGASGLVGRYIQRRAGLVDGAVAEAPTEAADLAGTTVMRCGFSDTLPHGMTQFRWIGTVNSVALLTTWTQPASFAFWIPGDLMEQIIAVVLLRSITGGTMGSTVHLSAFGPAEPFTFGNTAGMIRYTPVTFRGAFSVPNDFRAIIGETR